MKVLIVEDDERVRRLIRSIVAEFADAIYECTEGELASALYAEYQPDWVLMDLVMPKVDGITATRQIRSLYPQAKIIIVTSYDTAVQRKAAFNAGASGYVLKENLLELPDILTAAQ